MMDNSNGIKFSTTVQTVRGEGIIHFGIFDYGYTLLKIGDNLEFHLGRASDFYPEDGRNFCIEVFVSSFPHSEVVRFNLYWQKGELFGFPVIAGVARCEHNPTLLLTDLRRRALIKLAESKQKELNDYWEDDG